MRGQNRSRPFGIEEEYLLLDAVSGAPVDRAAEVIRATESLGASRDAPLDVPPEREYFSSQLETATPVCHRAEEAERALAEFRTKVSEAASRCGVLLASTGLPPVGGETAGTVTPKPRYRRIEAEMRGVAENQYAIGTHVHVEVPSRDAGVEVLVRLARWAPALLALTANSPLWCGRATSFASWRHIMALSWPVAGYPQGFKDGDEYTLAVKHLIDAGVVPDSGFLPWVVRLSSNYPTVELRIADAQLEAADSVAFAVIVRALVDRALTEVEGGAARPRYTPGIVNGANWMAARNGLGSELIDPLLAESLPAFELIGRMIATIDAEVDRFGDRELVEEYVARRRREGDPAGLQLAAFEESGLEGLLELYRG